MCGIIGTQLHACLAGVSPFLPLSNPTGHVGEPNTARNCRQPLEAEGSLHPTTSKKLKSSVLPTSCKELHSAHNLCEHASGSFFSRVLDDIITLPDTLITAL